MATPQDEFTRIREAIEAADVSLVQALDARADAVRAFLALRDEHPDEYFALPRDVDVLAKVREDAKRFPAGAIEPVFREVLGASAGLVAPVTVAYLGPSGAFPNLAAQRYFGRTAELRALDKVAAVFDEVERGRVGFGVVPLETSSDGGLTATLQGLVDSNVKICGELSLAASYHLYAADGPHREVEQIYASPSAIAACERHLRSQFPKATIIDVPTGGDAAQFARRSEEAAAVGTALIAEGDTGLRVVRERVEDEAGVEMRFAVVGGDHPPRTGKDRTIAAVAVHDEPGALCSALKPFADRSINLTRLQSRPAREASLKYVFFVELDGHVTDRPLMTALEELRSQTHFLKILGSYPQPGPTAA